MEAAPGEVLLGVVEEAVGIRLMACGHAELAQMKDRPLARVLQHLVFVEELCLLAQLVAQVAEHGGGLKGDLTGTERSRHLGQRLQLLADAEPVRRRIDRHAAGAGNPGGGADVAANEMLAGQLGSPSVSREKTLERIDDNAQLFVVYGLIPSAKLAHRRAQFIEGCSPLPQHANILPNACSHVKPQFTQSSTSRRRTLPARPHNHTLFPVLFYLLTST